MSKRKPEDCNPQSEKKAKSDASCDNSNHIFQVKISQPSALRLLSENINHVVKTVEFHIVKGKEEGDFEGLRVETLDDNKVCLVIGQLPCEVDVCSDWDNRESNSVRVSIEWLLLTLRQIDQQYSLVIEQLKDQEDKVRLRSFETLTGEDELVAEFHTLVAQNSASIKLAQFPVSLQLEMDLTTVRGFLKSCEAIKSEDVEIIVEEVGANDGIADMVTMKACDTATMSLKRTFMGSRIEGQESGPGDNERKVAFKESFSTKYLSNFLRSMNRTNVLFKMAPEKPLHVSYPLGCRDASITFVLAPRRKEE